MGSQLAGFALGWARKVPLDQAQLELDAIKAIFLAKCLPAIGTRIQCRPHWLSR